LIRRGYLLKPFLFEYVEEMVNQGADRLALLKFRGAGVGTSSLNTVLSS
jgi:hypothetical protein